MNLFFTSTLQHSVQSYSLKHAELLDASSTHPSPPNVFALSYTSHLLLSASISPPTIHLSSLIQKTPPILLHPQCSSSAAIAAGFHPERVNVFFLAFADSSLALYDASRFFQNGPRGSHKSGPASSGGGAEFGYIRKVHALGTREPTSSSKVDLQTYRGHDPSTGTARIGSKATGISGAAFVPGHQSTVMTVGADGKCCVISFQSLAGRSMNLNESSNAMILRSWQLHGPATCLSITSFSGRGVPSRSDDISSRHEHFQDSPTIAAVGCYDGHVLLYRLDGTLIQSRSFDADRDAVIGVEWIHRENTFTQSRRTRPQPVTRPKRKSLGSVFTAGRQTKKEVVAVMDVQEEATLVPIPDTPKHIQPYESARSKPRQSTSAVYHLDLESQTKLCSSTALSEDTVYQTATEDLSNSSSSDGTNRAVNDLDEAKGPNEQSSSDTIIKTAPYPQIPPRPTMSRPGGMLSRRRAETSQSRMVNERPTQSKAQSVSVLNMKNRAIIEPLGDAQKQDTSNAFSSTPEAIPCERIDLEPDSPEANATPSTKNKTRARKSALLSQTRESEASQDTVIDWSNTAAPKAIPTMTLSPAPTEQHQLTPPILKRSFARKPRKPAPASLNFDQSAKSDDTIVQWALSLKKSPRLFDIHKDLVDPSAITGPGAAEQTPPPPIFPAVDSAPRKLHPTPLAETAHNRSQLLLASSPSKSVPSPPPSGPPPPPPLPPRPAPREAPPLPFESQSAALLDETAEGLRHTLHKEFKAFRRDLHTEFEKQKTWFESLMRERDGWMRRVEEENGRLREELNRVAGRGKRR